MPCRVRIRFMRAPVLRERERFARISEKAVRELEKDLQEIGRKLMGEGSGSCVEAYLNSENLNSNKEQVLLYSRAP